MSTTDDDLNRSTAFYAAVKAWGRATIEALNAGARIRAVSAEAREAEMVRAVEAVHDDLADKLAAYPRPVMLHAALGLHALAAMLEHVAEEIDNEGGDDA